MADDYRPSWKTRLIVRLEEFDTGAIKSRVPPKLTKNLNGTKDAGGGLEAVADPDDPKRFVIREKGRSADQTQMVPETSADGLTHVISGVISKTFEWKQNGFRTADEYKCGFRFGDLPIDPRVIRSCAVEFYLGTVTALEFAQGVRGLTRGDVYGSASKNAHEPMNMVPDTYLDDRGNRRTNLRFQGWVDKFKMNWSGDEPLIELECTDNTRLFLNQLISPRLVIGGKDPIDKAVAVYLANFPLFVGFTVEYVGDGDAPALDKVLAGTAYRPDLGPQPGKGDEGDTVWDYITDVAGSLGLVAFVEGTRLVLARPSTILDGVAQVRPDDPYRERKVDLGTFRARALIYGHNVDSLEMTRDLGKGEVKNVEVRCYSARRKQVQVARYPSKDARIATATPGDKQAENKWTIVRITGVEDQKILEQIAEDYYNGRNRNEIEAVLKTKNLASFGGGNTDPDLLDMRAGDPIEVLVDRNGPSAGNKNESKMTAAGANQRHLEALGFSTEFAAAYARTYENAGFQRLFRAREISVTGDAAEGVQLEFRLANFVQVRGEIPKKENAT